MWVDDFLVITTYTEISSVESQYFYRADTMLIHTCLSPLHDKGR